MYISHAMLNSLTDLECLVLYQIVVSHRNYTSIAKILHITLPDVRSAGEQIFLKTKCWPRSTATLRNMWRASLELEKLMKEQKKDDAIF